MRNSLFVMEPLDRRELLAAGPVDPGAPVFVRYNINRYPTQSNLRFEFTVTYKDDVKMDRSSFDNNDIVIAGPRKFVAHAKRTKIKMELNDRKAKVTYVIDATSGPWETARSGNYSISLQKNEVKDLAGKSVKPKKYSIDVDLSSIRDLLKNLPH